MTYKPKVPWDLGLKTSSPAMIFWDEVRKSAEQQLKIASDAMTYQGAVIEMADKKGAKAKELYNQTTKK